jgi:hypothetical protein
MGPVFVWVKTNALYPLVDDTGVLTRRKVQAGMDAAWEQIFSLVQCMLRHPGVDCLPGLLGQFKLNGTTSFLLHNNGTLSDAAGYDNITDPQGHQVTTAELAVNGQVEESQVSRLPMDLEQDSD